MLRQLSTVTHRRHQWKHTAKQRGAHNRDPRPQIARITAERHRATHALTAARARLRPLESPWQALVARPKGDVVCLAWPRFCVARRGLRAVSRVLRLLAWVLGIKQAPCPQPLITWVMRRARVRIASARMLQGLPLSPAPCTHGLRWMIDRSMGLGTGKMLAVLAGEAHHPPRAPGALSLEPVHCLGGGVADAWTGETLATRRGRRLAPMGRPAASRKDGGGARQKAVA